MVTAVILKKTGDFFVKNWKIIAIIIGFFVLSGMAKRFFGRIMMWWSVTKNNEDPEKIDFDFMAMSVHSAMYKGLFNWGENEDAIIGYINSLASMAEFLTLCRTYALKYGKDLRTEIREHFNDKQYAKLNYK